MALLTRVRTRGASPVDTELALLRAFVAEFARVAQAASDGDSEARMRPVPGMDEHADLVTARNAFNGTLDRTDAFVREAVASLQSISERKFYRRTLVSGLNGPFRRAAISMNVAREAMTVSEGKADEARRTRLELADQFEETVHSVAEQVAAAATELSATAAGLSRSADDAVSQSEVASRTMARLDGASRQIEDVVAFISTVAAQTKLLALNAQIEAARAGAAGRGFDIVASEVKQLAETTARSTEDITVQVKEMVDASSQSMAAMSTVETTVRDMTPMVDEVRTAVDGASGTGGFVLDRRLASGLSQMAELLRAEVGTFLSVLRQA